MPAGQEFENGKPHWIYIAYSCWCYSPDSGNILWGQIQKRALNLLCDGSGPLVDVEWVIDMFVSQNMIQPATSFLLDALKENKQEQDHLQTCLLKMNLVRTPHKSRMPSSATRCSPTTTVLESLTFAKRLVYCKGWVSARYVTRECRLFTKAP